MTLDIITLKYNYEFSRVYKRGRFAVGKFLTVHCFRRPPGLKHNCTLIPSDINRIGFCANKKQLGAVGRNRAKRLFRESYRQVASDISSGYDIVFTLKTCSKDEIPSYEDICKEMKTLLSRLNLTEN